MDLYNNLSNMSNYELATILTKNRNQYTQEAINIALQIFEKRGLKINEINEIIKKENIEIAHENLEKYKEAIIEKLNTAKYRIDRAFGITIIIGIIILILSLLTLLGIKILDSSIFGIIDSLLIFILAFGIYKKSKLCAFFATIYFLLSLIFMNNSSHILLLSLAYSFLGLLGIITYEKYKHKYKRIINDDNWQ